MLDVVWLGIVRWYIITQVLFHRSIGGAAITCKNELETINEECLKEVAAQMRQSMIMQSPSGKVLGMDWSKRTGESNISCDIDCFRDQPSLDSSPFLVVHGAG